MSDKLREKIREILASNLGDSYFCTRVWSAWGYGTMSEDDFLLVEDSDNIDVAIDDILKEISTTKHETVEQWEQRTGETYPDDGPVWVEYRILKEDRIEWKLCILKDIKQWDHIASKYNIETSEISIVANHHGKPETE